MNKAIIIFSDVLNGIVFDTFEYFYRLWELDKSIKLISKYPIFTKDFHKKYNIDDNCFQNIIIDNPLNYKLTLALTFGTTHSQELNINVNFPIWCVNNDNLKLKGITKYFGEYTDNKDYTIKLYYQIHKVFKHYNKTYINCLDYNNIEYLKLLLKYPNYYKRYNNFSSKSNNKFNFEFYKEFNHHVYIRTNKRLYDNHPRIFIECEYQGIESEYYNFGKDLEIDPGYKRFLDRKDLEKRNILKDNLIEEFLSY